MRDICDRTSISGLCFWPHESTYYVVKLHRTKYKHIHTHTQSTLKTGGICIRLSVSSLGYYTIVIQDISIGELG